MTFFFWFSSQKNFHYFCKFETLVNVYHPLNYDNDVNLCPNKFTKKMKTTFLPLPKQKTTCFFYVENGREKKSTI